MNNLVTNPPCRPMPHAAPCDACAVKPSGKDLLPVHERDSLDIQTKTILDLEDIIYGEIYTAEKIAGVKDDLAWYLRRQGIRAVNLGGGRIRHLHAAGVDGCCPHCTMA